MASSVVTYNGARIRGASFATKRSGFSLRGLSALLGGGVFAGVCAVAAFASLHGMAQASHGTERFDKMLVARLDQAVPSASSDAVERSVHIRKFSRLASHSDAHQKMTRVAAEHQLSAKLFADRFGTQAAIDAEGQATVKALAALRPSAIVNSALGRNNPELAMLETQAKEHPAFEVALGRPQTTADDSIDLLPETVPLPSFRPEIAKAVEVEPTPRPTNPSPAEKELAAPAAVPTPARPPVQQPATSSMVAFARPDNPMRETKMDAVPWPDRGNGTAVYDISAGVVHLPSGEKLEAHSGIGKMRDNPDFVHVKMRGATPPSSYRLTMRESLFHGVEAIRLTPENGVNPHGRNGLLAHTYMLAKRGESNGCVVFKDYSKFLAAFKRGEVKRIVVVPKLSGRPSSMAASNGGSKSGGKTLFSMFSKGSDS
ncbi:DUF2778 domain-containing protein [Agrobacterium larrymoorei]|uniref:DUF2778 domain-containing protein n=1 Tax=Agrobacterium larrymoorei TaxID=160699 RepID=A0A4D7DMW8_9HYPH|nr:DUF2778 domain-containing protein [Agrobacterium larrymoorei]QCI97458.1 DUF2778 domain-containing protein [Agrobacterium larrymoorei]QYA07104.1 DUF2778 domain-containing protein [Agrobacterium larrymoorei]